MLTVRVSCNAKAVADGLRAQLAKQLPFAQSLALNRLAATAKTELQGQMRRDFDRPTAFVLNALRVQRATKQRLESSVVLRDGGPIPVRNILTPEVFGGLRHAKRHEIALRRVGILPPGWFAIPGPGAVIDANGNMASGQIVQILSFLQAFGQQGYTANSTAATRARIKRGTRTRRGIEYFAVRPGNPGLAPGVWMRIGFGFGKAVKPVLLFTSKPPRYSKRLDIAAVADRVIRRDGAKEFDRALTQAMRTAK